MSATNERSITVRFTPEATIAKRIIEVDPEGPTTFEVSELEALDLSKRASLEAIESYSYDSDPLKDASTAPAWIRDWSGPFECEITEIKEANA